MVFVSSALKVEVAESFASAPGSEEWDALLREASSNVVFLTREWQETWWESFQSQHCCQLKIVTVRADGGALVGIAPLFVEQTPLPPVRAYERGVPRTEHGEGAPLRLVRFVGGVEVADYLDIIAPAYRTREVWSALLDYLLQHRDEWDALDLHSLPEFSPSREALVQLAAEKGLDIEVVPEDVCPVIELPRDWETYLMGLRKKDRHELRRKVRKLEGRDDARWYLVRTDDPGELERGMRAFIDLHRSSGLDKAQFMDERRAEAFMEMAARLSRSGWLDLAILAVHDEPAAAYLSFNYHGCLYLYNSGYDPKFAAYSAGVALLAYRIHKAILQGVKTFDFLRGDEDYKYDFGDKDTYVYRAVVRVASG
jgi:CelD/BcsL family acetyltransferase involved in cellulose biosynthesis